MRRKISAPIREPESQIEHRLSVKILVIAIGKGTVTASLTHPAIVPRLRLLSIFNNLISTDPRNVGRHVPFALRHVVIGESVSQ